MFTRFRKRLLLSPDGGGGTGGGMAGSDSDSGSGEGTPSQTTQSTEPMIDSGETGESANVVYERPKYFSQVSPAKADSEDYKQLYQYQKLDELADATVNLLKENSALREDSKRSIVVPDGKDPEAVKEFARKLGIPDAPDGYSMKVLQKAGLDESAMRIIKENCHKAMLSDKQAESFGVIMLKLAKHNLEAVNAIAEQRKKNFSDTLKASYSEISADIDRASAAERDMNAYKAFAEESGLKDILDNSGMSYNSDFVKKMAAYSRKHSGQVHIDTVPGGKGGNKDSSGSKNMYGKEFNERYYGGKD